MRNSIKTVALLAVLSVAAAGCQKESIVDPPTEVVAEAGTASIVYIVDGVHHQATFSSDDEWQMFLDQMFAWAEEGRTVSFSNAGTTISTKQIRKIVTYETRDKKDAEAWADAMRKEGYAVQVYHDASTGIYTCIATL